MPYRTSARVIAALALFSAMAHPAAASVDLTSGAAFPQPTSPVQTQDAAVALVLANAAISPALDPEALFRTTGASLTAVTKAPIPGSILLFLSALGGLALLARRKSTDWFGPDDLSFMPTASGGNAEDGVARPLGGKADRRAGDESA